MVAYFEYVYIFQKKLAKRENHLKYYSLKIKLPYFTEQVVYITIFQRHIKYILLRSFYFYKIFIYKCTRHKNTCDTVKGNNQETRRNQLHINSSSKRKKMMEMERRNITKEEITSWYEMY